MSPMYPIPGSGAAKYLRNRSGIRTTVLASRAASGTPLRSSLERSTQFRRVFLLMPRSAAMLL